MRQKMLYAPLIEHLKTEQAEGVFLPLWNEKLHPISLRASVLGVCMGVALRVEETAAVAANHIHALDHSHDVGFGL